MSTQQWTPIWWSLCHNVWIFIAATAGCKADGLQMYTVEAIFPIISYTIMETGGRQRLHTAFE